MQRLILGSGKHWPKEDCDTFLDIKPFEKVDIVHNLDILPWPIYSDQYDHISSIHLVEHLDSLVNFMDECHRILKIGGDLYIETPLADPSNFDLMFCDPTHKHYYRTHSFINYFTKSGIEKFGYTDKAWAILHVSGENGILKFHGMPIK